MVIETIDKTYDVIGFAKSDEAIKRYICKDISDNREYKLICVCTRELIEMLMPFFLTHESEGKFRDYHGCFVDNGNLYLVFSYHEGQSIKDRLEKSNCTLEERIGLFGKLLEKLMLLAMPDGVAADVLKSDRILASDADEIEFSYELSNPASVVKNDKTDMQKRLLAVYDHLFEEELKRRTVLALSDYRDIIRPGDYDNVIEAYRLFKVFTGIIDGLAPEDRSTPHTKGYLAWEKVKSVFPVVKRVVLLLVALAAVGFLIWSMWNTLRTQQKDIVFDQIGTYEIDNGLEGK